MIQTPACCGWSDLAAAGGSQVGREAGGQAGSAAYLNTSVNIVHYLQIYKDIGQGSHRTTTSNHVRLWWLNKLILVLYSHYDLVSHCDFKYDLFTMT